MTVARFPRSILLPVSESRCANEATHLRKANRTSIVPRWDLGMMSEMRCKYRFRSSSSLIMARRI